MELDLWKYVSRKALVKSIQNMVGGREVELLREPEVKRIPPNSEGVTSFTLRLKVHFHVGDDKEAARTAALFVKCPPKYKIQLEMIKSARMFYMEWLYFEKIVPLMEEASSGRVKLPLPICYHTEFDGEKGNFYMQDLVESGYRPVDASCLGGLDLAHCRVVVRRLGRLHALAMAAERRSPRRWAETHPELARDFIFHDPHPGDPPSPIRGLIENFVENTKEFSRGMDGLPREAEASGALDKVIRGFWSTFCGLRATPSRGWSVLSHGDLWENNIMFRYERGEDGVDHPVDVKFFDMQMVKCCHPAVDFVYFVYQGTGASFRSQHLEDLVEDYYSATCDTLRAVGSQPPPLSLDQLKSEIKGKYRPYGIIGKAIFAPITMLREDPVVYTHGEYRTEEGLKNFFESGNAPLVRTRFARDRAYREKIEEAVREFVDMALPDGPSSTESSPLLVSEVL